MPPSSVAGVGPMPPDRAGLGRLLLIPLACLVLIQALLTLTGVVPVLDGSLGDSDAYMRLARVQSLHDGGDWFEPRDWRINPPEGHVQHWTRPLDAMLLAGAWLLQPWLGFAASLHLWGVLISPALLALAVVAIAWAAAPVLDRDGRLIAGLAVLMQPTVLAYSSVGRPDHHSLLLLLCLLLIGATCRLLLEPDRPRIAIAAGAIAALAIWVSTEALTFFAASLGALGLAWLWRTPGAARATGTYLLATTAWLALALLLERGPADLLAREVDRLSLIHLALVALLAGFWIVVAAVEANRGPRVGTTRDHGSGATIPRGRRRRVALPPLAWRVGGAALGVGLIALSMLGLFPEVGAGPLGQVDPLYAQLRLSNIVEIQALVPVDWLTGGRIDQAFRRIVQVLGIGLPAVPFLVGRLLRRPLPDRAFWLPVVVALALFVPLTFYQVRWATYAEAILVWPYAALVMHALRHWPSPSPAAFVWQRPVLVVVALLWPLATAAALPQQQVETAGAACPLDRLAPVLEQAAPAPATVLAYADYGGELLYRTHHRVLSIANHRPQPGFAATHRILTATDPAAARDELDRFGVDWILLCPSPIERRIFATDAGAANLYRRLVDRRPPNWAQAHPLPGDLAEAARLYRVTPSGSGATTTASGR